jgi:peptidoglycan/LPS O-acetylase OafA/YrhL
MSEGWRFVGRRVAGLAVAVGILMAAPGIASAQTTTTSSSFKPAYFLIAGVVMAAICGWIASTKGRSVVLWAVLGFCFGLIALIIIAVLKKQQPTMSAGMMAPPPPPMGGPPPPPPTPPADQSGF